MHKRTIVVALALAGFVLSAKPALADQPPNIVLILSDDQSWNDYGFMGHEVIQTPNLDKLAKESATFRRGYVPTALCRPSLATLITGLYAHQHGITGNDPAPTAANRSIVRRAAAKRRGVDARELLISNIDKHPTLPRLLANKGYLSFQSGKWWEGSYQRGGFTSGMTRGYPKPGGRHGDDGLKIGREGMQPINDFLDGAAKTGKPFFLWYAPFLPHRPHNPPQRILQKYQQKGRPASIAKYYAMCDWFDETCGQLLERLDEKGLADNTLVIYLADNGWIQRADDPGYQERSKRSPYEGGTRTPILFRWPGKIAPAERPELCSSIDVAPTILAAAGAKIPENLPGLNLLPSLESGTPIDRDAIFGESFAHDIADIEDPEASLLYRWVIKGRYKLLLTYDGQPGKMIYPPESGAPQLFDLQADPHERANLAAKQPQLVAKLSKLLADWYPVTERNVNAVANKPAAKTSVSDKPPIREKLSQERRNVLLISIDDLNDWVGCLGGHPQAATPNIDRFARSGTLFANAHCQSPVCNPSRTSMLTGRYPHTTGLYFLSPDLKQVPALAGVKTMPEVFAANGYKTMAAGKIFHTGDRRFFQEYQSTGGFGPRPKQKLSYPQGHPLWDWGAYPESDDSMPDMRAAQWAAEQLHEQTQSQRKQKKPFFLAVGFYRPHVPMVVPQKWFDKHPWKEIKLPLVQENDRNDLSQYAIDLTNLRHIAPTHEWMTEAGQWKHAVQAYLASTTFVDHCVGIVLDALAASPYADNTIVVLFSDHGFHLGEKQRWAKRSLWEDGTRVPLVIAAPGFTADQRAKQPVELIDVFPTLLELTQLAPDTEQAGQSLVPLLEDPRHAWNHPAITSFGPGNFAIRTARYRYIQYRGGSCELYDHNRDPHEWTNLSARPEYQEIVARHAALIPQKPHSLLSGDSTGHQAYAAANANLAQPAAAPQ